MKLLKIMIVTSLYLILGCEKKMPPKTAAHVAALSNLRSALNIYHEYTEHNGKPPLSDQDLREFNRNHSVFKVSQKVTCHPNGFYGKSKWILSTPVYFEQKHLGLAFVDDEGSFSGDRKLKIEFGLHFNE